MDTPYFVYQTPVMTRVDPETGYIVTAPWYINVATGEIVSRFEPQEGEFPLEGQVVKRSDYPQLFEILDNFRTLKKQGDDEFVLPDFRALVVDND